MKFSFLNISKRINESLARNASSLMANLGSNDNGVYLQVNNTYIYATAGGNQNFGSRAIPLDTCIAASELGNGDITISIPDKSNFVFVARGEEQ